MVKIEMSSKRQCEPPGRVLEASATASGITNSNSSAQAAFTGGLSNSKINSRQGPPEVPTNSKNKFPDSLTN